MSFRPPRGLRGLPAAVFRMDSVHAATRAGTPLPPRPAPRPSAQAPKGVPLRGIFSVIVTQVSAGFLHVGFSPIDVVGF